MATMKQFIEKALDESANKAFIDQIKKGGGLEGGPGQYEVFGKIKMIFKAESEEEAMIKASDFMNKAEKQNRKLGIVTEIDGIDGPM